MSEVRRLIDTSTLSDVLRQRSPEIQKRARDYLIAHNCFTFSLFTRFEILRGLHAKGAKSQLKQFGEFCARSEIIPINDEIIVKAAEIYGLLRTQGRLIDDIDILIAATALVHQFGLITENTDHFNRVPGLQIESWRP